MSIISFFKKTHSGGRAFNCMSIAMAQVMQELNAYTLFGYKGLFGPPRLYIAAWYCKVGILDVMEKYHFNLNAPICITYHEQMTRMLLHDAIDKTYMRLIMITKKLSEQERQYIDDILEGKAAFYEIDNQIHDEDKKRFQAL